MQDSLHPAMQRGLAVNGGARGAQRHHPALLGAARASSLQAPPGTGRNYGKHHKKGVSLPCCGMDTGICRGDQAASLSRGEILGVLLGGAQGAGAQAAASHPKYTRAYRYFTFYTDFSYIRFFLYIVKLRMCF